MLNVQMVAWGILYARTSFVCSCIFAVLHIGTELNLCGNTQLSLHFFMVRDL